MRHHRRQMSEHGIQPIDLVVVNLYPFEQATVAKPDVERSEAIENIDIGGPAMIRSAAKNRDDVGVVVDPADYQRVAIRARRARWRPVTRLAFRSRAQSVSLHRRLRSSDSELPDVADHIRRASRNSRASLKTVQALRYGENPHQRAALYRLRIRPTRELQMPRSFKARLLL